MTLVPRNQVELISQSRLNGFMNVRNIKRPLTEEELKHYAPSLFAKDKHGSRSDKYTYIPSIDIVRSLRKEGWEPFAASQSGARKEDRKGFTKHMVRMRKPDQQVTAVGDTLAELILRNAHDGTASYELNCGWFRLACLNGMVVSDNRHPEFHIKFPHRGDIIDRVVEGSYKVIEQMNIAQEQIAMMKATPLRLVEARELATAAIKLRFGDDNPISEAITADSVMKANRQDDVGNDLWMTFQRIQENLMKGGQRYYTPAENNQVRRNTTRGITGVSADVRLNKGLWNLAADLLHQKQAA